MYRASQKGLSAFEILLQSAACSSACPQVDIWQITENSSSILATWDKPFSVALYFQNIEVVNAQT